MKIAASCSLAEIGRFSSFSLINIENPLYPGYLDTPWSEDISRYRSACVGKECIVDGAYIDLNPGTPESAVRDLVMRKVCESIRFARAMDASEIIFLSTYLPIVALPFYDGSWISNSLMFWKEICYEFPDLRISICNTFEYSPEILLRLIDGVDRANFQMAFDLGHALVYSRIPLIEWWDKISTVTHSIYLHSNDGYADHHLPLTEGIFLAQKECAELISTAADKNLILKSFNRNEYDNQRTLVEGIINGK